MTGVAQTTDTTERMLSVRLWTDPTIDTLGHDPRSLYVETFWLPTLGPTALLLLRHLAQRFDLEGDTLEVGLADTAQALGLGPRAGRNSPLVRSLQRLCQFGLAWVDGSGAFVVRRSVPPVHRRHLRRLPETLRTAHDVWVRDDAPRERAVRRAKRLALSLAEVGEAREDVERILASMGFLGPVAAQAASWASEKRGDRETGDLCPREATRPPEPGPGGRTGKSATRVPGHGVEERS